MSTHLSINKDDLRELLFELTKNSNQIHSNLLGELKENQHDMKRTQAELKEVTVKNALGIDSLKNDLIDIKEQTTKTNGRVTSLERWKWAIVGGSTVLGALSAPNIGSIIKILSGT